MTCIALKDEKHLETLNCITEAAKAKADADALVKNASSEEPYRKLNGLAQARVHACAAPAFRSRGRKTGVALRWGTRKRKDFSSRSSAPNF